jgi:hypothetical protein
MMNPFVRLFIQGAPQVMSAVQGFGAKAAPAVRAVADTVTNPQTYRALAGQAERVLQRPLPKQFAGPNFGNIPTRFTGMITDLTNMPAGVGQAVQTGMVNRAIQEAAGFAPALSRGVTQTAEGALRAPIIGDALRTGQAVITNPLQTAIQTGGQFARDPGLRREFLRQFGGTTEKAARALAGQTGFGQVGSLVRSLSPGGITGLKGTAVLGGMGGMAWGLADPVPMIEAGGNVLDFLQGKGLAYDPSKDSRITPIQNRPVVNPGELAPDYSGASDREQRFAQYRDMGQGPVGGISPPDLSGGYSPPPAPAAPPLQEAAAPGAQAGQVTLPPPPTSPFGQVVLSNGAGVPAQRQNVQQRALSQEVLNAAQQYPAPTNVPLPAYYAGQQQLGRSMAQTGELQRRLTDLGAAPNMEQEALKAWVRANPGLAYRELMKLQKTQ